MLPYAAYLRVYEPLIALAEPERSRLAEYAASAHRPRRTDALQAEHEEAVRRLIAVPPIIAPARESEHAYVRQADGIIYVCPWQTRLRSWLALGRLRAGMPPALVDSFVPRQVADLAAADFARWHSRGRSVRTHILTATWHVPPTWFVPFAPPERWLTLGGVPGTEAGPPTAAATRTLMYLTTAAHARERVARALRAVRHALSDGSRPYSDETPPYGIASSGAHGHPGGAPVPGTGMMPGSFPPPGGRHAGGRRKDDAAGHGGARHGDSGGHGDGARRGGFRHGDAAPHRGAGRPGDGARPGDGWRPGRYGGASRRAAGPRHAAPAPRAGAASFAADLSETSLPAVMGKIEEVGRWLAGFHPRALVELDYGGLVHLMDDDALRADQSVAEVAAAVTGLETGELGLAIAMYQRLRARSRRLRAAQFAS